MKAGNILIVDDNIQILKSIRILLESEFTLIDTLKNPNLIPGRIRERKYDVILLDMNFSSGDTSGNEGLFWLREILAADTGALVIFITAFGDIDLAVRGIREGAADFITKPWNPEKLVTTLKNVLELKKSREMVSLLKDRQKQLNEDNSREFRMVPGKSPAFAGLLETIEKVAPTDAEVLITGENGTGKEMLARHIHLKSSRAGEVFVPVDMGSLSESLFESEMFGHVRGAFTDARENRKGRFETAGGGTLFLDEIANLSPGLQAKLLQVIQSRSVTRLGSSVAIPVDVRLITATNRSLPAMIANGTFREDLFYRLNTVSMEIPPLRDRTGDIPALAEHFLELYSKKYNKTYLRIIPRAMEKLVGYSWPGNVRELSHTIEKAVILCDNRELNVSDFFLPPTSLHHAAEDDNPTLAGIEKKAIIQALGSCRGNHSKAARMLDISRTTLYSKMKKYGL